MSQTPPATLTCPQGHTFPYEQLTIRGGLSVCPVCDQMRWAPPQPTWSRGVLGRPVLLLVGGVAMFLVEAISGIEIGSAYGSQNVSGAGWLVAGETVTLVALVLVAVGLVYLVMALRSTNWSRRLLSAPLLLIAGGAAMVVVGDLLDLGLNVAFVHASAPAAGWQLAGELFDGLFFAALAFATGWAALLLRRPDPVSAAESPGVAPSEPASQTPSQTPVLESAAPTGASPMPAQAHP